MHAPMTPALAEKYLEGRGRAQDKQPEQHRLMRAADTASTPACLPVPDPQVLMHSFINPPQSSCPMQQQPNVRYGCAGCHLAPALSLCLHECCRCHILSCGCPTTGVPGPQLGHKGQGGGHHTSNGYATDHTLGAGNHLFQLLHSSVQCCAGDTTLLIHLACRVCAGV
jgi:hypothetical protein